MNFLNTVLVTTIVILWLRELTACFIIPYLESKIAEVESELARRERKKEGRR